jgi:hypothetical protein
MLNRQRYNADPQIVAFADMQEAPISATVTNKYVSADKDGRKSVPAGLFIARRSGSMELSFLPRATVTQASSTSSPTLKLNLLAPFVEGDVLYAVEPYAAITISSVANGQTIILTVNGKQLSITATTNVVADAVNALATTIPSSVIGQYVTAVPATTAGKVYLYSRTKEEYPLTVAGTATTAIDGGVTKLTTQTTPLGTIASINPTTNTVTLTGNANWVAPVGAHIGVSVEDILGLHVHSHDFSTTPSKHINGITGAIGIYEAALPYLDDEIKERFPKMVFRARF